MTFTHLLGLFALLVSASAQSNFADYDYQDSFGQQPQQQPARPPPRTAPSRPQYAPSRPSSGPEPTRPPPVAILKQINRHNDDGSYTYGYEGADGSFKIETKLVTGEVMGKYGYVDSDGKLRTVEYGANRFGFQPSGEGITVPPPTLVDESTRKGPNGEPIEYDDGSYFAPEPERPAPRPKAARPRPRPQPQQQPQPQPQPQPQFDVYRAPAARPRPSSGPVPPRAQIPGAAPVFSPQDAPSYRPSPQQAAPAYRPAPQSAPAYRPAPPTSFGPPAPRPAPVRESPPQRPSSRGLLDDLAQQYALPQGGNSSPLTDISFGSYSSQTHF